MASDPHPKNEAELLSELQRRIRHALPLLPADIQLERHLHLRLGHRQVKLDGLKPESDLARGRYDLLVKYKESPLLLAELKAPEIDITEEDVKQALSYARLHDPMVPLVFVTNGKEVLLKRTYDGSDLDKAEVAVDRLSKVLGAAASLAASASEEALKNLLASSKSTWIELFSAWTKEAKEEISGDLGSLRFPLAKNFSIPREATRTLAEGIVQKKSIQVVHGPPMSGITNVLSELASIPSPFPVLYLNEFGQSDAFQFIANRLTRELSSPISKEDLRGWINARRGLADLVLVVDGVSSPEISELIENAHAGLFLLVLGMNSDAFQRLSTRGVQRSATLLGRHAAPIELATLSEKEFALGLKLIETNFSITFFRGAIHTPQLRMPGLLRSLGGHAYPESIVKPAVSPHAKVCISPILDMQWLRRSAESFTFDPEWEFYHSLVAQSFLHELERHRGDTQWIKETFGECSVDPAALRKILGESGMARLREANFISWGRARTLGPRIRVRFEELLSFQVAEHWGKELAEVSERNKITKLLNRFLKMVSHVPYGAIALATAIHMASEKNEELVGWAIRHLLSLKPTSETLSGKSGLTILAKDMTVDLGELEDFEGKVLGNFDAWIVLSHLATKSIVAEKEERTANFDIFWALGRFKHLLYRPSPVELSRIPAIHSHEIGKLGSFPCFSSGIIEPLIHAMLAHVHRFPQEFILLAQQARKNSEWHLMWRLLTVANATKNSADAQVKKASEDVSGELKDWCDLAIQAAISDHGGGET